MFHLILGWNVTWMSSWQVSQDSLVQFSALHVGVIKGPGLSSWIFFYRVWEGEQIRLLATHQVFNTSQKLSEAHNKSRAVGSEVHLFTWHLWHHEVSNHNHDLQWLQVNESFLQDEKSLGLNLEGPQGQLSLSDSFIFSVLLLVNHWFYHLHFICALFQSLYIKRLYINNSLMTSLCCHNMYVQ